LKRVLTTGVEIRMPKAGDNEAHLKAGVDPVYIVREGDDTVVDGSREMNYPEKGPYVITNTSKPLVSSTDIHNVITPWANTQGSLLSFEMRSTRVRESRPPCQF
jgi:hypothetical protein